MSTKKIFIIIRIDYELFNQEDNCGWEFLSQDTVHNWVLSKRFSMAWHFIHIEQAESALSDYLSRNQNNVLYFTIIPIYIKHPNMNMD